MSTDVEKAVSKLEHNWNNEMVGSGGDQLGASSVAQWFDEKFGVAQGWI